MNHEKLSKRLERVASYIPKDSILADIGSDHAYLPCYAILQELCKKAIAGEVVDGPYQSAKKQVQLTGLEHAIDVRKGNGLAVLAEDEATAITIAGMGGTLISTILEEGKNKLGKVERLILQPNVGSQNVRGWLIDNNWELIGEEILEEDEKIYEILIAERGEALSPYSNNRETEMLFGPFLMKEQTPIFKKKWLLEKEHLLRIVNKMDASKSEGLQTKRQQLAAQISRIEGVLK